jgi:hypothetical protein
MRKRVQAPWLPPLAVLYDEKATRLTVRNEERAPGRKRLQYTELEEILGKKFHI